MSLIDILNDGTADNDVHELLREDFDFVLGQLAIAVDIELPKQIRDLILLGVLEPHSRRHNVQ